MAVEKMKLLSITGKEENIDEFVAEYLLDSGIQTEDAVKVYEKSWKLANFEYDSTAKDLLKKCKALLDKYKIRYNVNIESEKIEKNLDYIDRVITDIKNSLDNLENGISDKKKSLEEYRKKAELYNNTKDLDIDLNKLYNLEYIRFRYGKILRENYGKLENSIKDLNAFLVKASDDEKSRYIWVMCFATKENSAKADSYLNVFKFERFNLPVELDRKPKDIWIECENKIQELNFEIENKEDELIRLVDRDAEELVELYAQINLYIKINNVKKFMAYDENGLFYIIGWIPAKELTKVLPKLSKEKDIKYVIKNHDEVASIPPTKLNNNRIVRPFETLVKMYGLPSYTELDPTTFVAITAFLLFGFMFGDVGHGFVIFLIGLIMAKKKISMGPVFEAGGVASIVFGILYGSIFGNEHIIPAIFIRPMENIQTMLIYGIAIGVILILLAMLLNIRNGIKNKDKKKIFFDTNGVAGLIFYISVLTAGVYFIVKGKMIASLGVLSTFIVIPLLAIMFKDTITEKVFKENSEEKSSLFEKVFHVVEILLSFASNTISFVRIAAFAINHVGLCMAIYILADMFTGTGSIAVTIFGNVLVIVLEGLIVGIQVLRLEYYELFSRFYTGDGKEYKPLREKI